MGIKHILLATLIAGATSVLTSCTDANFDKATRYNSPTHIECYQYDVKTLDDTSTGRVEFTEMGNFYYRSKTTGKLVQVVGMACTIKEI